MTTTENRFKRGLQAGTPQLGLWLTLNSVGGTEILAGAGYGWMLLDMEHTCVEPSQVLEHLRAATGGTAEVAVRVPTVDPVLLKRLLDGGVRTIMFPQIKSVDDARQAVAATRYPPRGIRGVAGNMRANRFNRDAGYMANYEQEQCVVLQLETLEAIECIEALAAVEGVDALFVGPNDLAANMGYLGKPTHERVQETIAAALRRIKSAGKYAGILDFSPEAARGHLKAGFDFIAVGSDSAILARRSEALLAEIKAPS